MQAMPPLENHGPTLMAGFERRRIRTRGAEIEVAVAGDGPPLLLIHGNPLTLVSWHKVAPTLARSFTVVAMDLLTRQLMKTKTNAEFLMSMNMK